MFAIEFCSYIIVYRFHNTAFGLYNKAFLFFITRTQTSRLTSNTAESVNYGIVLGTPLLGFSTDVVADARGR